MSTGVSGDIRRLTRQLNTKVTAEEFYDAHQLVRALFERFAKKNDLKGAIEFAEQYAEVFAKHEQYELCIDLGQRVLSLMKKIGEVPNKDSVGKLTMLFLLCPPNSTLIKYDLLNDLILWLESFKKKSNVATDDTLEAQKKMNSELDSLVNDIHSEMANAYLSEWRVGECQNHLVFCDDVERLVDLTIIWRDFGYFSERYFYALRLSLILLHQQKIDIAGQYLAAYASCAKIDMDKADCPPQIQLAYLTWAACQYKCYELYELIGRKYVLILRMDECIARLYHLLEARVFKIKRQENSLMGMLVQMMGSMKGGNLPQLSAQ